jgi:hypothetical protein
MSNRRKAKIANIAVVNEIEKVLHMRSGELPKSELRSE